MAEIGIVEGFFGPEWSWESRHHFIKTLSYGGKFYIYAPKRDSFLRKNWSLDHPKEIWQELLSLSEFCSKSGISFGVGLSPFEIHDHWNESTKQLLSKKVKRLEELDLKYLGLFFDDMKGSPDLAEKQGEIVEFVRGVTKIPLFFCPTYYSDDPILDKVFGERPKKYLEKIGEYISKDIEILWTGNKVISQTILASELDLVAQILKRKPFLWDNYFANDGPRQCKFLRLKPLRGRDTKAFESSSGWAFNLMNQPNLSEILFCSSVDVLKRGKNPEESFKNSLESLAGELSSIILSNEKFFNEQGLDQLNQDILNEISKLPKNRFGEEILDWFSGKYIVGSECLTD